MGFDGISKEHYKAGTKWLIGSFNAIFKTAKMPDELMWSTMEVSGG